jgi:hypothetical protein
MTQVKNTIALYEGSYQFNVIYTDLNISPDFAQMKLAQQYEYRKTTEDLWAEITINGMSERFVLDYNNFKLNKIT